MEQTSVCKSTLAPCCSNLSTTSTCPSIDAIIRGVSPICSENIRFSDSIEMTRKSLKLYKCKIIQWLYKIMKYIICWDAPSEKCNSELSMYPAGKGICMIELHRICDGIVLVSVMELLRRCLVPHDVLHRVSPHHFYISYAKIVTAILSTVNKLHFISHSIWKLLTYMLLLN